MKKILLIVSIAMICLGSVLLLQGNHTAEQKTISVKSKPLTNALLSEHITLIDIRTPKEWKETGIIPQSHLITFYKEDKSYDEIEFLAALSTIVKKDDTFVVLCRSGNRSSKVARFLASKGYSNVINLSGGIQEAIKNNIHTIPYM